MQQKPYAVICDQSHKLFLISIVKFLTENMDKFPEGNQKN
jgi:hypothetical protein